MILVSGYYGFGNLGDEAILAALCRDLSALGFSRNELVVLSGNPKQTEAEHGVRALPRYNLAQLWRALGQARCLVSGGGSLLQDVTSRRSIPYYLGVVELALLRRVPVVMYGQGLGPVTSPALRRWVGRAFRRATAISVRDEGSVHFLANVGVPKERITLTADPVFGWERSWSAEPATRRLLINLRPYAQWEGQRKLWVSHIRLWIQEGWAVEFVPLGPGDGELGRFLQAELPELEIHPQLSLESCSKVLRGAAVFLSMRLHGLIFGALQGCLPLGLNYDPKVEAISAQLDIPLWELDHVANLPAELEQVLTRFGQLRASCERALTELHTRALKNQEVLARGLR